MNSNKPKKKNREMDRKFVELVFHEMVFVILKIFYNHLIIPLSNTIIYSRKCDWMKQNNTIIFINVYFKMEFPLL